MKYSVIFLLIVLVGCKVNSHDKERHILPEGFTGPVKSVFNYSKGQEVIYKDKVREYTIPESGLLYFTTKANPGGFHKNDIIFSIVNKKGKEIKQVPWITTFLAHHKIYDSKNGFSTDSLVVFNYGFISCNIESCPNCRCTGYIVDTVKNMAKYGYQVN